MTTNYEQSKAYAENGQYARAQTFALLAIADRLENVGGAVDAALKREKAARDDIIVHEMEAAYLRAGLERLHESSLSSTQRRHVQSVLNHTWTPA